jgi:hypothetical protein
MAGRVLKQLDWSADDFLRDYLETQVLIVRDISVMPRLIQLLAGRMRGISILGSFSTV